VQVEFRRGEFRRRAKCHTPSPISSGAGNAAGGGRFSAMAGPGSQVVQPPPSLQGAGTWLERRILGNGLSLKGSQVVPPPPSFWAQATYWTLDAFRPTGCPSRARKWSLRRPQCRVPAAPLKVPVGARFRSGFRSRAPPRQSENAGNSGAGDAWARIRRWSQIAPALPSAEGAGNSGAGRR